MEPQEKCKTIIKNYFDDWKEGQRPTKYQKESDHLIKVCDYIEKANVTFFLELQEIIKIQIVDEFSANNFFQDISTKLLPTNTTGSAINWGRLCTFPIFSKNCLNTAFQSK